MSNRPVPHLGATLDDDLVRWRVWAPGHRTLELILYELDGATPSVTVPMTDAGSGFFEAEARPPFPRVLYKVRVDGDGPFPDPLSRSQPFGVHGPSEVLRLRHAWTDDGWKGVAQKDLVLYELHVGTFTPEGTFDAAATKLPHLKALGVTAVELLPLASFPGERGWGYDGVSLFAPHAHYGGPEGLARFVDAAHAHGLGVFVDVVYNHLGPDGNYIGCYSPHFFTSRHHTPWGDAVNYDGEHSAAVRELVLQNVEMWIRDYHADGLRLDATHAIFDDSPRPILREIGERARAAAPHRHVVVVAEDERNDSRLVTPAARGGFGLDGVWADDFHHAMRRAFAGDQDGYFADFDGTTTQLARIVSRGWLYEGQHSKHHGHARGTPADPVAFPQFVWCLQNHDQVGNRAFGDRLGASVDPATQRAMTALLLLGPATPLLWMGQEWNASTPFLYFTDHHEDLGRAVTRGRREEFKAFTSFSAESIPDPQARDTFERSRLDWDEPQRTGHREMLAWVRALLTLRREHPALHERARSSVDARAPDAESLVMDRRHPDRPLSVVLVRRGTVEIELPRAMRVVLSSDEPRFGGSGGAFSLSDRMLSGTGPLAVVLEG